ncbi:hypothetical protein EDC96DRAFT_491646 [Choanephora cucurbitarum]|nr:hypothetical protein EDC96DRAFT_491646 [Choanephora cucurbitarum]
MTTDELTLLIHSLQDQIKKGQEVESELRHQLETLEGQQRELHNDNDYLRQKMSAIQLDNSNYSNSQARLETQLYAQEQDISSLRKEIQQLSKAKRDAEKKLIAESQDYENDKSMWQQREADLYNQIRSLSVNNSNEPRTPRTPRRRSVTGTTLGIMSPFTTGLGDINENNNIIEEQDGSRDERPTPKLASIDSSYAREAKIAQRTIKAQDKLILDLKSELEKQKNLIAKQQSEFQLQSLKLVHLEHEIANVKQLNRSLMEDNESYQILLHEKTMNGEFMMNPIMQVEDNPTMKESASSSSNQGLNLAEELASSIPDWQKESEADQTIQKLNDENKTLQDTNRALQLYMNKILMKIINNKQLEDVLSIDQPSKPSTLVSYSTSNKSSAQKTNKEESGPAPTRTVSISSGSNNKDANRQRRRTISYWGSKAPPSPSTSPSSSSSTSNNKHSSMYSSPTLPPPAAAFPGRHQDGSVIKSISEDRRRHSSLIQQPAPQPERSVSTSTTTTGSSSGWAKALRRMSGIGWSSSAVKEEPTPTASTSTALPTAAFSPNIVNSDSAVSSMNEEDTSRKSSGSSTPSARRSNELGTLDEE